MDYYLLKDCCEILDSKRIPITAKDRKKGNYPYYGANGIQDYVEQYIFDDELVLLAEDGGNFGSKNKPIAYRVSGKCWVNNHAHVLKPRSFVDVDYLCYSLMFYNVENIITGATRKKLTQAAMNGMKIPKRDMSQQRLIVSIIKKVEDIITYHQNQLKLLDELVKSRFIEMFGDLANPQCRYYKCKLEELCSSPDDIKCGPFGTQLNKDEYQTEGVAIWEIPQINSGFNMKPTHFLTNEKARQLKAYSIRPGDIAMSRKGNVGKCALFPFKYEEGIIHSDVLRIRVDKNIVNPCFIVYQLHFSNAIKQQIKVISSGAIMAGINVTKLKGINVHVPSLKDQCKFSDFILIVGDSCISNPTPCPNACIKS